MKLILVVPTALLACLLFSSCATIINGSRQTVSFRSTPPGATISINDSVYGKTPMSINLLRKRKERHVKLSMEGYESYEMLMVRSLDGWIVGNILFGGLIGIAIDVATGSMYHVSPERVEVQLKPTSTR